VPIGHDRLRLTVTRVNGARNFDPWRRGGFY